MNITLMENSDALAMVGLDFEITYAQAFAKIKKAQEALLKNGEAGKIAIFAENSPNWAFALYGAWLNNSTVTPIDAKCTDEEVAFILSDAEPNSLCVGRESLEVAKKAVEISAHKPQIIVLEDLFEGEIPEITDKNWKVERPEDDLALIVYTSGTTGNPKGVMLTFANLYANIKSVCDAGYFFKGVRVLTMLPFHHILPLMGTLIAPLSVNGRLTFPRSIAPTDISEALQKYPVDMVVSVPRFYEVVQTNIMAKIEQSKIASTLFGLAKLVNNKTFSRKLFGAIHKKFGGEVKYWISGGAALDRKAWRDLETLGFTVCEGYGMTECAPIITFPRIGKVKIGSPGQPLSGIEIKIDNEEIAVRGANVTQGYYKRPEENAETIRDGWLYTGDLGYVDSEQYLHITGRRKELIVLPNGKKINPIDIETLLKRQSDEILETGVLNLDGTMQAVIRVSPEFVEKYGAEGAEEFVRNNFILPFNRGTVPYKRIIKFVLTTQELPRTRVGKLKRHLLPDMMKSARNMELEKAEPEPTTDTYVELKSVLESQISMPVRPDAHMEMDLGLDSLGKISMQCYVQENLGVNIVERDFEKYSSLREFAKFVEENRNSDVENKNMNISWAEIIGRLPQPKLYKPNCLHFISIFIFKTFGKLFYKTEYIGLENLKTDKPVIIAPNHQSYLDGLFVVMPFSKTQLYKTYFFAKLRNILKGGLLKKYADRSNVIIMDINDNVSEALRKLATALREGNRIIIFPEGTRTKDGLIADFKQSFAILAKEMNIEVIPVAISGAYEAVKANATLPTFGSKAIVEYLPAMSVKENESYADFATRVKEAIEKAWDKNTKRD